MVYNDIHVELARYKASGMAAWHVAAQQCKHPAYIVTSRSMSDDVLLLVV